MDAHLLTTADAAAWGSRLPRSLYRVLVLVPFVVLAGLAIGGSIADTTVTVADLAARSYGVLAAVQGLVVGGLVIAAWRPDLGAWLGAALACAAASVPETATVRGWLWVVAVAFAVLSVVDAAAGARQRVVARAWGPTVVPDLDDATRVRASRWRWPALAAVTAAAAVAVFAAVLWHHDASSAAAFRADSEVAVGTVVAVEDDGFWADVEVGQTRHRVDTELAAPEVGDAVEVRFARHGDRAELTDQVFDPTGAIVLLGLASALGAGVALVEAGRRRAVRRLLVHGGVAVTVAISPRSATALLAVPVDTKDRTEPVVARLRISKADPGGLGPDGEPEEVWQEEDDEPDIKTLPDDELLRAAAALVEEPRLEVGPAVPADTTALVVGLHAYGDLPFVHVDGQWWSSDLPARDDRGLRQWRGRPAPSDTPVAVGGERVRRGSGGVRRSAVPAAGREAGGGLRRLNQRVPTALPLLAWVAVVPVASWLFGPDGADWWGAFLATVGAFNLGSTWTQSTRPLLRVVPDGLWQTGGLLDEHVPWSRVVRTVADDDALVVRLVDDALLLPVRADGTGPALVAGTRAPDEALRLLEDARMWAVAVLPQTIDHTRRRGAAPGRRRLSVSVVGGVAWGAAVLVPAVLALT
ncbi:hypothetical protein [Cellulomonas rhizosphaerae]|uniref:hypothetical protein n=1 Tax=Cellulomonas rhizosphaerae TaxID=2293719 RepID=UPI0010FDB43F|nr:hypothetical protein [Cellulomonas rhizosphaerae]